MNELKSIVEATPFLSEKRLVIVKGLLKRFEPKDKSNRNRKSNGSSIKQDEIQSLVNCIKDSPQSTILVLIDTIEIRKTSLQKNLLFNAVSPQASSSKFPSDESYQTFSMDTVQGGPTEQQYFPAGDQHSN